MAETADTKPQAEIPTQLDKPPAAPSRRSGGVPAIVVSISALVLIGAAATYLLQNFNSIAELLPHEAASAPIPDPVVSATLKDIQSFQQKNAAARKMGPFSSKIQLCCNKVQLTSSPSGRVSRLGRRI